MAANSTDRFNGVLASTAIKAPCKAVAIANITLSGEQTVNSVAVVADDRVLVTAQTSSVDNGIYDVSTGAWTRAADWDGARDVVNGTLIPQKESATLYSLYMVDTANPIVPGTTAVTISLAALDLGASPIITGNLTVNGEIIGASSRHVLLGYTTGRSIIRSMRIRIAPGATPGTNINLSDLGASFGYNALSLSDATDLAKSGSSGSYALDAGGTNITIDPTEVIVGILSSDWSEHDINSSSTTEMYVLDLIVNAGNIDVRVKKRGSQALVDWTTIMDAGDRCSLNISFVTST